MPGPFPFDPRPFCVAVPAVDRADLRLRLHATRWPTDVGNEDWRYGVERRWIEPLIAYWADGFDWDAAQSRLNELEQYIVEIDDVPVHYGVVRSTTEHRVPVILTHGWPWTSWDWYDVAQRLADPGAYGIDSRVSCDVVIPSLPGYAFSTPLPRGGITGRTIAGLWHTLMVDVLGHGAFVAAGADWGATVTSELANLHPETVRAIWLGFPRVPGLDPRALTAEDFTGDESWMWRRMSEIGPKIQSHNSVARHEPQTLAYALNDSPAGLAAWLWARRHDWSEDPERVVGAPERDRLCTIASIYWFTQSIGSSLRLYLEHFGAGVPGPAVVRTPTVTVPTAYAAFAHDLLFAPRHVMTRHADLRRFTMHEQGGHFAPAERPDLVAGDILAFLGDLEPL